ncbi:MAG: hypothetical protein JO133_07205 [Burkholderiaceae bacterium]|nr:hypothetical protein [Burkholderiaceae bacterium]
MRRLCLLAAASILLIPSLTLARGLLRTDGGADRESALASLAGKASGATITGPGGTGGACVYTGRGSYLVGDDGVLQIEGEQSCGGIANLMTLPVCHLSADLKCGPIGRFPHRYQITNDGLTVDGELLPWRAVPGTVSDLLSALKARILAEERLERAQTPSQATNTTGLVVRCRAPRQTFTVNSGLSYLMYYQQRPDPEGVCADRVLTDFLAGAHVGEPVGFDSPVGRCLTLAGKVTDWAATQCEVASNRSR